MTPEARGEAIGELLDDLIEWFRQWNSSDDGDYCPCCGRGKWNHDSECELLAIIRGNQEVKP